MKTPSFFCSLDEFRALRRAYSACLVSRVVFEEYSSDYLSGTSPPYIFDQSLYQAYRDDCVRYREQIKRVLDVCPAVIMGPDIFRKDGYAVSKVIVKDGFSIAIEQLLSWSRQINSLLPTIRSKCAALRQSGLLVRAQRKYHHTVVASSMLKRDCSLFSQTVALFPFTGRGSALAAYYSP